MVGIFDCGGVLGKYEIRLKERKVVNMEALNTYKTEKTLAEQMNERLAEMKMTKAEAALKMNYSRAALSQYLNGKYASDPTELEKKVREFLAATGGVAEGQEPETAYLQEQAHSRRRWSSLRAETLCRPLVCVRHVRSTWGLG